MVATWSNSEESNFNEENQNITNLCLMTQEDKVQSEYSLDFHLINFKIYFINCLMNSKKSV